MGDISDLLKDGGLLIAGGGAGLLIKALISFFQARNQRTEITPQPLEVRVGSDPVSKGFCDERHKSIDETLAVIRGSDLENIYGRLGKIEKSISAIDAKQDLMMMALEMVPKRERG